MGQAYGVLLQQAKACFDVGDYVDGLKLAADARDIAQTADQLSSLIRCVERMSEKTRGESPKGQFGIRDDGVDDGDDDEDDGDGNGGDGGEDVQVMRGANFATCDFLVEDHQKLVVDSDALLRDLRARLALATQAAAPTSRNRKGRGSLDESATHLSLRSLASSDSGMSDSERGRRGGGGGGGRRKRKKKGCACVVM